MSSSCTIILIRSTCEFLEKLDLTVNFCDLDTFKESIEHLVPLQHFKELYLMGNPCMEWEHATDYIIAKLPQLQRLDGQEITKTHQIKAMQKLALMESELMGKAVEAAAAKKVKEAAEAVRPAAPHRTVVGASHRRLFADARPRRRDVSLDTGFPSGIVQRGAGTERRRGGAA